MTKIQFRRGTASAWTAANPVLDEGEPGWDETSHRPKFGDGVSSWATRPYSDTILTDVVATVNSSGAVVVSKHNPVDATSAAKAMTIADATSPGLFVGVSKIDSSTNQVNITAKFRGSSSTSTISLNWQHQSLIFVSAADGTWWPVAGHITKASLDATYTSGGGGGGTSSIYVWRYSAGWPALPGTKPTGVLMVLAVGPTQPSSVPSWIGTDPTTVPLLYAYSDLT